MVRVFENLMSRNDEVKVESLSWLETDMFSSPVYYISLITMAQIKPSAFFCYFFPLSHANMSRNDKVLWTSGIWIQIVVSIALSCIHQYLQDGKIKTKNLSNERS